MPDAIEIDSEKFAEATRHFREMVAAHSPSRRPFQSFREGVLDTNEGFKLRLREEALSKLNPSSWSEADLGTGLILECAISAIEIEGNNLLSWDGRNGPASTDHRKLVDARGNPSDRLATETLLFRLYKDPDPGEELFDAFVDHFGRIYPLMGYLWFLRDAERFVPLRPEGLQSGIRRAGIDYTLVGRCSWENYAGFIDALHALRPRIAADLSVDDVTLIDAHSFVWVVGYWQPPKSGGSSMGLRLTQTTYAAEKLAERVMKTVSYANGQTVSKTVKEKTTDMTKEELKAHIAELIESSGAQCQITHLPVVLPPNEGDPDMAASIDRIHSDKGYVRGNLQIVCWFVNRWKSDDDPENFRRLIDLVRSRRPDTDAPAGKMAD
ncbi:hypothetical protein GE300_20885 [Rhodobacteraceae bacterium 2CG4]|uniref:Uncharacterized protein n=1 Tax=Halovulum marinum TaxID=2662447 RepID=A0A6L5Z7F1_9RHOB|nr:hypothetical protein [Halovulum marinum]MSU92014.1 hypothetical protein [Halovulum marinum]